MKKKSNRPIGLIKTKGFHSPKSELFRLIGINNQSNTIWLEDEVSVLSIAKELADEKATAEICYYVYDGSNRIVHTSKEE